MILRAGLQYLRNLNLFPSKSPTVTDSHTLQNQILSTRLFILSFCLSLVILIVYTFIVTATKTLTLKQPTSGQYAQLYDKYQESITCPCTQISIDYGIFIHVNYTLHQVCTSSFVTNDWLMYLRNALAGRIFLASDFHVVSETLFTALRSLCELVSDTFQNTMMRFYATGYVSNNVIPISLLKSEVQSLINQLRSSIKNDFFLSLGMVRQMIQANALISSLQTNFYMFMQPGNSFPVTGFLEYGNCSCAISAECISLSTFYDGLNSTVLWFVRGMHIGCYVLEALLQSSLECFYDPICFDSLKFYLSSTVFWNGTVMNGTTPSRFLTTSTVGDILDELMIEIWNWTLTFDKYFEQCRPIACSYTVTTRNDAIYLVTTLIGLVGGLVTALKLVVPNSVNLIRKKKGQQLKFRNTNRRSTAVFIRSGFQYVRHLNIFPSTPPTITDPHTLQNQIISTRLFILSFCLSLAVLLFYTSLVTVTKTLTLKYPTNDQYAQLYGKYQESITCPCTQISIDYGIFIHVNYTLHQVCTSAFVTENWFNYLRMAQAMQFLSVLDFRITSQRTFQALLSLCELVDDEMRNSLIHFYATQYVSSYVISPSLLESEAHALVNKLRSSTINDFFLSLGAVRQIIQANGLESALKSNAFEYLYPGDTYISIIPMLYGNCSCAVSAVCSTPSALYNGLNFSVLFFVRGMRMGCYVLEALLQSSLECFYDPICFDSLKFYLSSTVFWNGTVMNGTTPSRFLTTSTVGDILDELMIEIWNWTLTFDKYFEQCRPIACSYTVTTRNDVIHIVTTLIGLVGGLLTGLKLILPNLVIAVYYVLRRRKRRICEINVVANDLHEVSHDIGNVK
ncbi:unnamed protein product [Rotaria socialis]|uniref:Uncharacterized protein n=2 Tax=Rotaria socialis TaxID=392032 RepID=A0A820UAG1_9BILA|nr:unnamed protein product [Rotaria socialis]